MVIPHSQLVVGHSSLSPAWAQDKMTLQVPGDPAGTRACLVPLSKGCLLSRGLEKAGTASARLETPGRHRGSGGPSTRAHSWVVGNWSRCSRSCDAGVRSRSVVCQRRVSAAEEKALDDSACPQPRPPVLEACHGPACPPEWAALDWSEVSRPSPPARTH